MTRKFYFVCLLASLVVFATVSCKSDIFNSGRTVGDTVVEVQFDLLNYLDDTQKILEYGEDQERFYAQAHSVTRFLLRQGGQPKFLQFLRDYDPNQPERALREHYRIGSISGLENHWLRTLERAAAER